MPISTNEIGFKFGRSFLLLFMFHVCLCYTFMSFPCSLAVICLERIGLLGFLCVVVSCVLSVPCQVWYLIVLIPDLCHPLSFYCGYIFE